MKIGVFDSGLGGLSVVRALEKEFPEHEIVFRHDPKHFPYGSKKPEELVEYTEPVLYGLIREGCSVIVVACTTISATVIDELRKRVAIHLVAVDPMVRQAAALTKSGVIAVCATPTTLKSDRYLSLKEKHAKDIKVLEPNCSSWAKMIDERKFEKAVVADAMNDVITLGADVIVLGSTLYRWVEDEIRVVAKGNARLLKQDADIIKQLKKQITVLQAS